jgi:hypothetical protein
VNWGVSQDPSITGHSEVSSNMSTAEALMESKN